MAFPDSVDEFIDKVDKRPSPVSKVEEHVIPAGEGGNPEVYLEEAPEPGSLLVTGSITFTEVDYDPVTGGEFYVNYNTGQINFYTGDTGKTVNISYLGLGSALRAHDFNQIYDSIERTQYWDMKALVTLAGSVTETDPPSAGVLIKGGTVYIRPKIPVAVTPTAMDFTAFPYLLSAITPTYWMAVLIMMNQAGDFVLVEGNQTAAEEDFTFTEGFEGQYFDHIILAEIHVQDDGSGAAGTILPVQGAVIFDRRPVVYAGGAEQASQVVPSGLIAFWVEADPIPPGWEMTDIPAFDPGGTVGVVCWIRKL